MNGSLRAPLRLRAQRALMFVEQRRSVFSRRCRRRVRFPKIIVRARGTSELSLPRSDPFSPCPPFNPYPMSLRLPWRHSSGSGRDLDVRGLRIVSAVSTTIAHRAFVNQAYRREEDATRESHFRRRQWRGCHPSGPRGHRDLDRFTSGPPCQSERFEYGLNEVN